MKYLACLLALIVSVPLLPAAESLKPGQPLPRLAPLLPGAKLPSTQGKVVLLDFWASWCVPCKASFPALNRLQSAYASKGLVILAVGVDDDPADYQKFVSVMKPSFPVAHDATHQTAATFNPSTMPTSYLIDRKGVIRHVHNGYKGAKTEKEYVAEIEALLAETR